MGQFCDGENWYVAKSTRDPFMKAASTTGVNRGSGFGYFGLRELQMQLVVLLERNRLIKIIEDGADAAIDLFSPVSPTVCNKL